MPLSLDGLVDAVDRFGPTDLYGWDYIDRDVPDWCYWQDRLSLDEITLPVISDAVTPHFIHLFKESTVGPDRVLDLRIWFEGLRVQTPAGEAIEMEAFIRQGKRWWDAMYSGDKRTALTGIVPGVINQRDP